MAENVEPSPHPSSRVSTHTLRLIGYGGLAAGLLWLVLTRTLPTALAVTAPDTALFLQPNEPRILLKRARAGAEALFIAESPQPNSEETSEGGAPASPPTPLSGLAHVAGRLLPRNEPSDGQPMPPGPAAGENRSDRASAAGEFARRAISAAPFNAGALTVLGQLAELDGDLHRTAPLMEAAARFSPRESYAVYWLMKQALAAGDHEQVIAKADTLLRTRSPSVPLVVPVLAQLVETNKATSGVAALLAADPPWRPSFFAALPQSITDARTPLHLFRALQSTALPASEREISSYLDFLMNNNFHELAYYSWLELLPRKKLLALSPLNNGGFEAQPSGVPFDWTLPQGSGFTAELRSSPDLEGGHSLFIGFMHGRAEFDGVKQTTLLGPGTYSLAGRFQGTLVGRRGLVWRVTCLGGGRLAQSELLSGEIPQWRDFSLTFTVPPEGCRAQQIRLDLDARSASEKLVTGSMWFDDLALTRGPTPEPRSVELPPSPEL